MPQLRWLRAPLVHFLVGGALLFRLVHGTAPFAAAHGDAPAPVVVTAGDVARLRTDYTRETGVEPTPDDEAALIDKTVEEELLFREALARGLDRNDRSVRTWLVEQMTVLTDGGSGDPDALYTRAKALGLDRTDLVVRRILVQKMRLLAARSGERPPSDDTLRTYYAQHQDDYASPARVSLWHVFLASATHGAATARDDAVREGESFPVPSHLVGQSPAQIAKVFGPEFAAAIDRAQSRTWIGPVASAYGMHLVWIDARETSTTPSFDDVRDRVRERWQDEQRRQRVIALVRDLARRYPLEVESAAWRRRSAS